MDDQWESVSIANKTSVISMPDCNRKLVLGTARSPRQYLTGRHNCSCTPVFLNQHTCGIIAAGANGLHFPTQNVCLSLEN